MAAGNLCMQEVGSYRAQRVTGRSASVVIINAIIDQIGQGRTMKGGDEFGASVYLLTGGHAGAG